MTGIGMGKSWMGLAVTVTILGYITLSAIAVARGKKTSKRNFAVQKLDDTQTLA